MKNSSLIQFSILFFFLTFSSVAFSQENIALSASEITTSHVSAWEDLYAVNNNIEPQSSSDKNGGAYGNWNGADGEWHWVAYEWDQFYLINQSDVYWWTDGGGIQIPYDTRQEYWDFQKEIWVSMPDAVGNGTKQDQYNVTTFTPVLTNKIRVHMVSTVSAGILEWKVWGQLGEQVPERSTHEIDLPLEKNITSEVVLTAKNSLFEPVQDYIFKLDLEIKNEITGITETYTVNGTNYTESIKGIELDPTTQAGETTFSITIPAEIDYKDGITVNLLFNDGYTRVGEPYSIYAPGQNPPALSPDVTENSVDNNIEITFTDGALWQSAIKNIYLDGELLNAASDYELQDEAIVLTPAGGNTGLTTSGTKTVLIQSVGYEDVSLSQSIHPGATDPENTTVKTRAELYSPTYTFIEISAKDSYGNLIEDSTFDYDITVINDDATTSEVYTVGETEVTADLVDLQTDPTDNMGVVQFPLSIPPGIDLNDGISITFKLPNGADLQVIEFINDGTGKEIVLQNGVKNNAGFSWERTAQSENFIVYWGEKITGYPTDEVNGSLSFDPQYVLDVLEDLLIWFNDSIEFIGNPDSLNMGKYKHEIVMNETWNNGYTGWAFGGSVDGKIGGMWIHPGAVRGPAVLAHEFTHMNQAMVFLQYPGYGINMPYAGFFWESHANFMMKNYTESYSGVSPERYIFTSMMHYSTTRRHYQNIYFLDYLNDKYGMELVNNIWRNADPTSSHPLTSLRDSVLRYTQDDLNDEFGYHAMKNVTWDYSSGDKIRSAIQSVNPVYLQRMYTILDSVADEPGRFVVPEYLAPGDYGYNIIPLYPDDGSTQITINFTGLENDPAQGAGWRYGFVGVDNMGTPRYSTLHSSADGTATFSLLPSDSAVYFVVTGAPQMHHNYPWEPGYTKVFRYPYTLTCEGAVPAGHKPGYNRSENDIAGSSHANGGGWVASTATVDASAYVGPNAQVLGYASVLNDARIEDFAIVTDQAVIRNAATVRDQAIVGGSSTVSHNAIVEKSARVYLQSSISDMAVATGSALLYNATLRGNAVAKDLARISNTTYSGTAIIGGDAENISTCTAGTYLQISRGSNPDGRITHPMNTEVNPEWPVYIYPKGEKPATPLNLAATVNDDNTVTVQWDKAGDSREVESYYLFMDGNIIEIVQGTVFEVSDLAPLQTYNFTVKAVDRSGNVSGLSEIVSVSTLASGITQPENGVFKIYPNPVTSNLYLEAPGQSHCSYIISDMAGRIVFKGNFDNTAVIGKEQIGTAGTYLVRLMVQDKIYHSSFIISP
jgi:hypothetical protein